MDTTQERAVLVEQLHRWSQDVVGDEVRRLARREPRLTDAQLQVVREGLDGLVGGLLLSSAQRLPARTGQLRDLFGLVAPTAGDGGDERVRLEADPSVDRNGTVRATR